MSIRNEALRNAVQEHDGGEAYRTDPVARLAITLTDTLMLAYADALYSEQVPGPIRTAVERRVARALYPPRAEHMERLAGLERLGGLNIDHGAVLSMMRGAERADS